jgi:hypothetical protein
MNSSNLVRTRLALVVAAICGCAAVVIRGGDDDSLVDIPESLAEEHGGERHSEIDQRLAAEKMQDDIHEKLPSYLVDDEKKLESATNPIIKNTQTHYLFMIIFLVALHIYVYQRDSPAPIIACVYVLYLCLHTSSSTMQVKVGKNSTNSRETASAIVFASLLIKVTVSSALVGYESLRDQLSGSAVLQNFNNAKVILVPACLYTTSDLVLVYAQQNTSMTEVQNFSRSVSLPLTCFVWFVVFRVGIGFQKLFGLAIIMIGASMFSFSQTEHMGPDSSPPFTPPVWTGLTEIPALWVIRCFLLFQAVVATFAGVSNEYFLLKCGASVNVLNTTMYICGMCFVVCQSRVMGNALPMAAMGRFGHMEWLLAALHATTGIVTSYFLKYLGSIWKQVAFSVMMVMFFTVDIFILNNQYKWRAVLGLLIGTVGTGIYIVGGISTDRGMAKEEESPKDAKTPSEAAIDKAQAPLSKERALRESAQLSEDIMAAQAAKEATDLRARKQEEGLKLES